MRKIFLLSLCIVFMVDYYDSKKPAGTIKPEVYHTSIESPDTTKPPTGYKYKKPVGLNNEIEDPNFSDYDYDAGDKPNDAEMYLDK